MTIGALILAGGAGERMRAAGVAKPLVAVRGVSLLERNLCALLGAGLRQIWIACGQEQGAICGEIARLAQAAARRDVRLHTILECAPLGTIGAAGQLRGCADTLLTVNADNLCALDLGALLARHAESGAALTLATHDHEARLPYGEIATDAADRVIEYREKPARVTRIASAICVLGPRALAAVGQGGKLGLHELTARLVAAGDAVRAVHHAAPWIDINEPADIARAAALLGAHADRFECWAAAPDREVAGAVLRDGDHILLEHRRDVCLWDTPGGKLEAGESAASALVRELREELGVDVAPGPALARFDSLEPDGRALRHHVFARRVARAAISPREGQTLAWFPLVRLPDNRSPIVERSLAVCAERTE